MLRYCLPLTMYVIGPAETEGPRFVSHSNLPSPAFNATNCPSRPPANNTFDAVVRTPPSVDGTDSLNVHLRSPVFGSIATIELKTSSPAPPRPGPPPVKLLPSSNSGGASLFL